MFSLWREFTEFRRVRDIVRLSRRPEADQKAMAEVVATPGYACIKAMMMSASVNATVRGDPSAPGLARAVGVIAQCEVEAMELTRKVAGKREDEE